MMGFLVAGCVLLCSCHKDPMAGKAEIGFGFTFGGKELVFNNQEYITESGNRIKVTDIRYFVSGWQFVDKQGKRHGFSKPENQIHYIDSKIASTLKWNPGEEIPAGVYDYVEFVYGLDSVQNRSGRFLNLPEANMAWPEVLGGGYHYMQMNGYWASDATDTVFKPFGVHTGIGQGGTESSPVFYQNYVKLCDTVRIYITEGHTASLTLNMEVSEWFRGTHVWDFGYFGGSIMQNQEAQQALRENIGGVFSLR